MSKRNLILLIIVLVIAGGGFLGYLYLHRPTTNPDGTITSTNFFSDFNPFAPSTPKTTPDQTTTPTDDLGTTSPSTTTNASVLQLKKVSSMPVAGFGVFMKETFITVPPVVPQPASTDATTGTTTPTATTTKAPVIPTPPATEFSPAVRYVARETGNIYETFADAIEERQFSTTVIPKVYEASFGNSGQSVMMRYLKDDARTIETFVGSLPKELLGGDTVGNNQINGSFLPENITDTSVSPDTTQLFYLFNTGDDAVGTTAGALGEKRTQVFNSSFTEWLSQWPNSRMVTLTTKPSANVLGYMYAVDPIKKDFNKVLGGVDGLTTLTSPDGKSVLYSDNNLNLNIYNTDAKASTLVGVKTLPEKCVWGSASDILYCAVPKVITPALYPDSWYQGEVSFSDSIWKIDAKSGNTTLLLNPTTVSGGENIDGTKLALDNGENYLFFVNKKDSYLWELPLK